MSAPALWALLLLAVVAASLGAAVIPVTTTSDSFGAHPASCSLREAIEAANSDSAFDGCPAGAGADVVLLSSFATYALARAGAEENANQTGDLDVASEITIRGDTSLGLFAWPFVDGDDLDRVIEVRPGGKLTLERVKIVDGSASIGGGILSRGELVIRDAGVSANTATGSGGGIYLHAGSSVRIERATISSNVAEGAGGGLLQDDETGHLLLEQVELRANVAGSFGGGADVWYATIRGSLVVDNEALYGGGLILSGAPPKEVVNSTISGNRALESGGGLFLSIGPEDARPRLTNLTVTDNEADFDADGEGEGGGLRGNWFELASSLVAGNRNPTDAATVDCSTFQLQSLGYNLFGVATESECALGEAEPTSQFGTPATPLDPGLDALATNGGPTRTHALLPGSPAIDSGDPAGCAGAAGPLWTDQRGYAPRAVDGDADGVGRCDVGAFELHAEAGFLYGDHFESGGLCEWSAVAGGPAC